MERVEWVAGAGSGFLTLEDWDRDSFRDLMLFREVCLAQFCTADRP